jgi:AhpD family alkylhydroperoxidase
MPHLTPLSDEQASEARPLFQGLQSAFSLVPNIFRSMGHAPAVLQATLAMNQAIQTDLDPKLRELAYLKASQVNHCGYCMHYHTGLGRKSGLSDAQVKDLENFEKSSAYSDLEKKVLRFADQWVRKGKVDGELVSDLSKALSQKQLVILAATVGLANWCNRFNVTFGVELP